MHGRSFMFSYTIEKNIIQPKLHLQSSGALASFSRSQKNVSVFSSLLSAAKALNEVIKLYMLGSSLMASRTLSIREIWPLLCSVIQIVRESMHSGAVNTVGLRIKALIFFVMDSKQMLNSSCTDIFLFTMSALSLLVCRFQINANGLLWLFGKCSVI